MSIIHQTKGKPMSQISPETPLTPLEPTPATISPNITYLEAIRDGKDPVDIHPLASLVQLTLDLPDAKTWGEITKLAKKETQAVPTVAVRVGVVKLLLEYELAKIKTRELADAPIPPVQLTPEQRAEMKTLFDKNYGTSAVD